MLERLEAARALHEIGRRLQIAGGDPFRAKAFLRGAAALQAQPESLRTLVGERRLRSLRGIGPALAAVIEELHRTGRSGLLERLRSEMPRGALELSRIPLSLPRMRALEQELGISGIAELEAACRAGRVKTVRGFGPRTEERLLAAIERLREGHGRLHLHRALAAADELVAHMLSSPDVERAEVAGELRRRAETVSSLPLVATGASAAAAAERLLAFPLVETIAACEPGGTAAILTNGLPVRLAWAEPGRYGTLLVERTGSDAHRLRLETLALERGLGASGLAGIEAPEEAELYARLGLPWIPPELREGAGEVEAALAGSLPRLVTAADVEGMVHCHTDYSDGRDSVLDMARAARRMGGDRPSPGRDRDPSPARDRVRHPVGRHARLSRPRARAARRDRRERAQPLPDGRAGHDAARDAGARAAGVQDLGPRARPADQPPAAVRVRHGRDPGRGGHLARRGRGERRPLPPRHGARLDPRGEAPQVLNTLPADAFAARVRPL